MKKKIVYIAHPIATDEKFTVEQNIADILRIIKNINIGKDFSLFLSSGLCDKDNFPEFQISVIPLAPYIGDVLAMNDAVAHERKRGIDNGIAIIETGVFDELWLTGHKLSLGMQEEVRLFKLQGKPIINLIDKI